MERWFCACKGFESCRGMSYVPLTCASCCVGLIFAAGLCSVEFWAVAEDGAVRFKKDCCWAPDGRRNGTFFLSVRARTAAASSGSSTCHLFASKLSIARVREAQIHPAEISSKCLHPCTMSRLAFLSGLRVSLGQFCIKQDLKRKSYRFNKCIVQAACNM